MENNQIEIYQNPNGNSVEVRVESETIWLNLNQISALFDKDKSNISRHIKNIFKDGELAENATVAKIATVVERGFRGTTTEDLDYYNLDMIISVGYRVSSVRATAFRRWATNVLKQYMVDGYAVNNQISADKIKTLVQAVDILNRTAQNQIADVETAKQAVKTISDFVSGFSVLDNYDNERLDTKGKTATPAVEIGLSEFLDVVQEMKPNFATALFGIPKDDTFASSVGQIYQSFDGKDLYPTLEEKAATLLYLVVKNHSFADGNKRIAASCFIYFLARNNLIYTKSGAKIIDDGALAALTLLIAESKPSEMETMRRVVISILNLGTKK